MVQRVSPLSRSLISSSSLCLCLSHLCQCPKAPHMGSMCAATWKQKLEQIWEGWWKMTTTNTVSVNTSSTGMLPPQRLTEDNESGIFVLSSININNIHRHKGNRSGHEAVLRWFWTLNMWDNFLWGKMTFFQTKLNENHQFRWWILTVIEEYDYINGCKKKHTNRKNTLFSMRLNLRSLCQWPTSTNPGALRLPI